MQSTSSPVVPEGTADQPQPTARLCAFEVENFRLFRQERLEVHPDITVLVGLNDVGKSTLLEAIRLYGQVQRHGFREVLEGEDFLRTGREAVRFKAEWEVDRVRWTHLLEFDRDAVVERLESPTFSCAWAPRQLTLSTSEGTFEASRLQRYASLAQIGLAEWQLDTEIKAPLYGPTLITRLFATPPAYLFEPQALAEPAPADLDTPSRNGFGWSTWLQAIINRRDGQIESLEHLLQASFPNFRSVKLNVLGSDSPSLSPDASLAKRNQVFFLLDSRALTDPRLLNVPSSRLLNSLGRAIPQLELDIAVTPAGSAEPLHISASKTSSGLLLALAHLALVHARPEGALLLLEEPENGLNARITLDIMRAFLAAVRQRKQQLILTTHNAWWLDLVPADGIRVLTRDEHGAHIHAASQDRLRTLLEQQDLYPSEVVSAYGPEGLLYLDRATP